MRLFVVFLLLGFTLIRGKAPFCAGFSNIVCLKQAKIIKRKNRYGAFPFGFGWKASLFWERESLGGKIMAFFHKDSGFSAKPQIFDSVSSIQYFPDESNLFHGIK